MKEIIIKIICSLIVVVLVSGIGLGLWYGVGVKPSEMQTITVGDGKTVKVGIISDTQLQRKDAENSLYGKHLRSALTVLKEQKVDVVLFAGDFSDTACKGSYGAYNKIFNEVFSDKKPETVYIMGNHDNWYPTDYVSVAPKQRLYKKSMGESPWTHKVINGFHFIGVSPDGTSNTAGYSDKVTKWMEEQIKIAEKDTPGMPIFVVTHHNPKDTAYGSDEWYDDKIGQVMKNYSNVVSISGHSHYSIYDERSIDQKDFTAFTTQSLAYIELEGGKFDPFKNELSSIPPYDDKYPAALIMNVSKDETTIERWNIVDNKEEKANMRWTLNYPLTTGTFTYNYDDRKFASKAPVFEDLNVTYNPEVKSTFADSKDKTLQGITFKAATTDDIVHSYRIVVTNGKKTYRYTYFSDFYNGMDNRAQTVNFALDKSIPKGTYKVNVYAINSYGKESEVPATGTIELK